MCIVVIADTAHSRSPRVRVNTSMQSCSVADSDPRCCGCRIGGAYGHPLLLYYFPAASHGCLASHAAIAAVAAHTALAMASWNSTTEGGACTSSIKMPSPEFGVMWFPLG